MCLGMFLLRFILYGTLCTSWTGLTISFSMLGKFSTIISLKFFLIPFLFLFFFWDPYTSNVGVFDNVPRFLRLSSVLFILFTLFCSSEVVSTILYSSSRICSSASVILLLIPSRVFLIFSNCVVCLYSFFLFSIFLLNVLIDSYISSILFSKFWTIFYYHYPELFFT